MDKKMKFLENINPFLRHIKVYFRFLFDEGYYIRCFTFRRQTRVVLEGPKCLIYLYIERGEIFLSFAPKSALTLEEHKFFLRDQITIRIIIYYISKKQKFIGLFTDDFYSSSDNQLLFLSKLVQRYHNQITPYFEDHSFYLYKNDFDQASVDFNTQLVNKYVFQKIPRENFDGNNIDNLI